MKLGILKADNCSVYLQKTPHSALQSCIYLSLANFISLFRNIHMYKDFCLYNKNLVPLDGLTIGDALFW